MKITYITPLKWWGEKEAKKVTPKGYDFEYIKLDEPIHKLILKTSYFFRLYCDKQGWENPHYIGDYKTKPANGWSGFQFAYYGKSYVRSFVSRNQYIYIKKGDDRSTRCSRVRKGSREHWLYVPYHENLHTKTHALKKPRKLHDWIKDGKFDSYEKDYLDAKPISGQQPLVKRKTAQLLKIMKALDNPMAVSSAYRSNEEQDKEFAKVPSVTNARGGESMHNYGIAVDLFFTTGVAFPPAGDRRWQIMNVVAEYLGFYSYGRKLKWDYGHIELLLDYSEKDFMKGNVDYSKFL